MDRPGGLKAAAAAAALLALCGCQSTNGLVKKNRTEQLLIDQQVDQAHQQFAAANYAEAEAILAPLAAEKTVNQPLYLYELSSVYLLGGKKEEAHRCMLEAHRSIEGFFDEQSEKSAASLWGQESKKVFKGDPYERGTLYMLLALSFMEQGNVDNALAALKTGMLADSDTENQTYQADYALLQFLAAKCYDLRQEPELRDQMMDACFTSLSGMETLSSTSAALLAQEYAARAAADSLGTPPSRALRRLCMLASEQKLARWLQQAGVADAEAQQVAAWASQSTSNMNPMAFNTLVLLWNGEGPDMSRAGEYGEKRIIHPGILPTDRFCSILVNQTDYDGIGGFGDVSFQATTRGGRLMDNVLGKQAAFKGAMDTGAGMLLEMSQQDYGNGAVNLGMLAVAGVFKATASATKVEADIRHWQNLPCEFEMLALELPPGSHEIGPRLWRHATPLAEQLQYPVVDPDAPLTVVHMQPPVLSAEQIQSPFSIPLTQNLVFVAAKTQAVTVDINNDGELSTAELEWAVEQLIPRFDRDQDGVLSELELNSACRTTLTQFSNEMVVGRPEALTTDGVKK